MDAAVSGDEHLRRLLAVLRYLHFEARRAVGLARSSALYELVEHREDGVHALVERVELVERPGEVLKPLLEVARVEPLPGAHGPRECAHAFNEALLDAV